MHKTKRKIMNKHSCLSEFLTVTFNILYLSLFFLYLFLIDLKCIS